MKINNREMLTKYIMSKTNLSKIAAGIEADKIINGKFLYDILAGKNICKNLDSKNRRKNRRMLKKVFDAKSKFIYSIGLCLSSEEKELAYLEAGIKIKVVRYKNPNWNNSLVLPFSDSEEYRNAIILDLCGDDADELKSTTSSIELMNKNDFENLPEWDG